MNPIDIVNGFKIHEPSLIQQVKITRHASKGQEFAELINGQCPDNHQKSMAIDKIKEAIYWANESLFGEEVNDGSHRD